MMMEHIQLEAWRIKGREQGVQKISKLSSSSFSGFWGQQLLAVSSN